MSDRGDSVTVCREDSRYFEPNVWQPRARHTCLYVGNSSKHRFELAQSEGFVLAQGKHFSSLLDPHHKRKLIPRSTSISIELCLIQGSQSRALPHHDTQVGTLPVCRCSIEDWQHPFENLKFESFASLDSSLTTGVRTSCEPKKHLFTQHNRMKIRRYKNEMCSRRSGCKPYVDLCLYADTWSPRVSLLALSSLR